MFKGGPGDYNRVMIWTSGSLWGAGWAYVRALVPVILLGGAYIFYKGRMLDALSFSDETAIGWGISIERERKKMLLCAVTVAYTHLLPPQKYQAGYAVNGFQKLPYSVFWFHFQAASQ